MAFRPPNTPSLDVEIVRWTRARHTALTDPIVTEEPLEIRVRSGPDAAYATLAITMLSAQVKHHEQ